MPTTVILPAGEVADDPRTVALRSIAARRGAFVNEAASTGDTNYVGVLTSLRERGVIYLEPDEAGVTSEGATSYAVLYLASHDAKVAVSRTEDAKVWSRRIQKRHSKVFRITTGSLFRFPFEKAAESGSTEGLDAFITDWSPYPAAVALVVHGDHPFVRRMQRTEPAFFTGEFVRNALTADLMPVWVAPWVKLSFGSGVVAVNPAHDRVDLAFAREMGMLIRFGLQPAPITGDPSSWPSPPVINEGVSTKTGRGMDGIPAKEVVAAYFDRLAADGYGRAHTDLGLAACRLGTLDLDPEGEVDFTSFVACGGVARNDGESPAQSAGDTPPKRARFVPGELGRALLDLDAESSIDLLCPTSEMTGALLYARLFYRDRFEALLEPVRITLYVPLTESVADTTDDILTLASFAADKLDASALPRKQNLDQAQMFLKRHAQLIEELGTTELRAPEVHPAGARLYEHLREWRLKEAIVDLYALQKRLYKNPRDAAPGELAAYCAAAHIIAGVPLPPGLDVADVWPGLSHTLETPSTVGSRDRETK